MKIKSYAAQLKFRHTFHIAAGARDFTDTVFVEVESDGNVGYGEAALPPYLTENVNTVLEYLAKVELPVQYSPDQFFELLHSLHSAQQKNNPALAALDSALHDLQGKIKGVPVRALYDITENKVPMVAYTIGMGDATEIRNKLNEAADFRFFKMKLGGNHDQELVSTFRKYRNASFCVDVNRGWNDLSLAIDTGKWLVTQGCTFIEQPFEKVMLKETNELRKHISIPVILDEAVQTIEDVERVKDFCDGINIKLVKCGGIYPAKKMIEAARKNNLKVFLGCMSESSCGVAAASQLTPLVDWMDLDSPMLISNDPFEGVLYKDGKIVLSENPGTGARKRFNSG